MSICRETGVVVDVDVAGLVHVRIDRADACAHCESKGACHALGGANKTITLKVPNTVSAQVGDHVVVALPEVSVIKASAAIYLLPALTLMAGALLGAAVGPRWDIDPNGGALAGVVLGLALGLGALRLIGRGLAGDPRYAPTLVEIVRTEATVTK